MTTHQAKNISNSLASHEGHSAMGSSASHNEFHTHVACLKHIYGRKTEVEETTH
jgi:hypothetical protein